MTPSECNSEDAFVDVISDDESDSPTRSGSPSSCDAQSKASLVKRPWTPEEDEALVAAVQKYGACRWSMIATNLSTGRVGKQCRERWNNHLCPHVKKSEWSEEEDRSILQGVAVLGTRWCEIVKSPPLAGRTDNAIKNRFYSLQRRMRARQAGVKHESGTPGRKRSLSDAEGGEEALDPGQRERIVSIATELAFSTDEQERDRLICLLTSALHECGSENGADPPDFLSSELSFQRAGSGINSLPRMDFPLTPSSEGSPLFSPSSSRLDHKKLSMPTISSLNLLSHPFDHLDAIDLNQTASTTSLLSSSSESIKHEGESPIASPVSLPWSDPSEREKLEMGVCLGGRHAYRAALSPLHVPLSAASLLLQTPKRLCTPIRQVQSDDTLLFYSHAKKSDLRSKTHSSISTDSDEPGLTYGTDASLRADADTTTGTEEPGVGCAAAGQEQVRALSQLTVPSPKLEETGMEHLNLSFFTDLFSDAPISSSLAAPVGPSSISVASPPAATASLERIETDDTIDLKLESSECESKPEKVAVLKSGQELGELISAQPEMTRKIEVEVASSAGSPVKALGAEFGGAEPVALSPFASSATPRRSARACGRKSAMGGVAPVAVC